MEDLIGKRFTRLVVVAFSHKKKSQYYWLCVCDCGNQKLVAAAELRRGNTKSCKCLLRESVAARSKTHGLEATPIYCSYYAMQKRCYNPEYENWGNYGGRGIIVCERWLESFENFNEDMGPTWAEGLTLDRKNTNGNYEKDNCKWSTAKEQARNRRNTVIVGTPKGPMFSVDAAKEFGISHSCLLHRIDREWPQSLLFSPMGTKRPGVGRWANHTPKRHKPKETTPWQ